MTRGIIQYKIWPQCAGEIGLNVALIYGIDTPPYVCDTLSDTSSFCFDCKDWDGLEEHPAWP